MSEIVGLPRRMAAHGPFGSVAKPAAYTQQDVDCAHRITNWLKEHDLSRAWLSKKAKISSSTISQVLSGKYPSSPTTFLQQMEAIVQVETERLNDGTPGYVETSVHKMVTVVCDRTRKHANFGVVCGVVGIGKTRSLKEYTKRKPQTLLVEANPQMTAGSLLIEILRQLGRETPHGLDRKFNAIVTSLAGTNFLVIVDEAEKLNGTALEYLRRIRDKAGVGVVLSGTQKLHELLKPTTGQFDQIRSRIAMWPKTIERISRDDADDLARESLGRELKTDLADDVLDALWAYGGGSARMLMEGLVPSLRDYAVGKMEITVKVVDQVASQLLFLEKRNAK